RTARPGLGDPPERLRLDLPPTEPHRHGGVRVPGRRLDEARALDPRTAAGRRVEPADREAAVPRGTDREVPPDEHLPEARRLDAYGSAASRLRAWPRPAAAFLRGLAPPSSPGVPIRSGRRSPTFGRCCARPSGREPPRSAQSRGG